MSKSLSSTRCCGPDLWPVGVMARSYHFRRVCMLLFKPIIHLCVCVYIYMYVYLPGTPSTLNQPTQVCRLKLHTYVSTCFPATLSEWRPLVSKRGPGTAISAALGPCVLFLLRFEACRSPAVLPEACRSLARSARSPAVLPEACRSLARSASVQVWTCRTCALLNGTHGSR